MSSKTVVIALCLIAAIIFVMAQSSSAQYLYETGYPSYSAAAYGNGYYYGSSNGVYPYAAYNGYNGYGYYGKRSAGFAPSSN